MDGTTRTVDKLAPHRLISADRVQGTAVYNGKGEKLGTIENVMIDKISGHVAYAIMAFGGFLGIGDKQHPLPWDVLDFDTDKGGYVVDLDRQQLMDAPQINAHDTVLWTDNKWHDDVHKYYGVPPTWL